jgi:hypothetical protein
LLFDRLIHLWPYGLYCSFHFFLIDFSGHLHPGD